MSQYLETLQQLFSGGHLTLVEANEPTKEEIALGEAFARDFEQAYRLGLSGTAPFFQPEPFNWAAVQFYRAVQFVLFRDIPAEVIQASWSQALVGERNHAAIYSVDLVFRFLPDLLLLARSEATDDPVTHQIQQWLLQWPLSNADTPTEDFSDHPTLCQMYVERLVRKSRQRIQLEDIRDPRIRTQLQLEYPIEDHFHSEHS